MRDVALAETAHFPVLQRAEGRVRLCFRTGPSGTLVETHYDEGSGRARLLGRNRRGTAEVVLLNTAGGMTGGDRFETEIELRPKASVIATSQAAERIYRSPGGAASVETRLMVAADASLDWLPQETIVFDRSALRRRIDIDCAPSGRVLAVESVVLGRTAMGETVRAIDFHDHWQVRRGGKLIFADGTRLTGNAAEIMSGGATGGGAAAFATVLLIAPDAEPRLAEARAALRPNADAGVSTWNGMVFARLLAPSGLALRQDLVSFVEALRGAPMPRGWST